MSAADRAYRLLLRAYPAAFRADYGREMVLVFRDQRRDRGVNSARFWVDMVWDVARSAPALRVEALRARWARDIQTGEDKMKTMAILAVLIGALDVANAVAELWAGGIMNGDRYSLIGGTLGIVAGALLLVAGIALARRTPRARTQARVAAMTCLAAFVVIGVALPRLSIFAMLLGIGFPIVLLLFLGLTGRRGPSVPTMA
jgi:peptidoglycan/LPS O-acetylase OafA/YrhL